MAKSYGLAVDKMTETQLYGRLSERLHQLLYLVKSYDQHQRQVVIIEEVRRIVYELETRGGALSFNLPDRRGARGVYS